jgi:hypothetical protein
VINPAVCPVDLQNNPEQHRYISIRISAVEKLQFSFYSSLHPRAPQEGDCIFSYDTAEDSVCAVTADAKEPEQHCTSSPSEANDQSLVPLEYITTSMMIYQTLSQPSTH